MPLTVQDCWRTVRLLRGTAGITDLRLRRRSATDLRRPRQGIAGIMVLLPPRCATGRLRRGVTALRPRAVSDSLRSSFAAPSVFFGGGLLHAGKDTPAVRILPCKSFPAGHARWREDIVPSREGRIILTAWLIFPGGGKMPEEQEAVLIPVPALR